MTYMLLLNCALKLVEEIIQQSVYIQNYDSPKKQINSLWKMSINFAAIFTHAVIIIGLQSVYSFFFSNGS